VCQCSKSKAADGQPCGFIQQKQITFIRLYWPLSYGFKCHKASRRCCVDLSNIVSPLLWTDFYFAIGGKWQYFYRLCVVVFVVHLYRSFPKYDDVHSCLLKVTLHLLRSKPTHFHWD